MAQIVPKMTARQWFLVIALVITAIFFVRKYMPVLNVPTRRSIDVEISRLKERRKDLAVIRRKVAAMEDARAELRAKAAPFWQIEGKNAEQAVVAEFTKIARRAKVSTHRVDKPHRNKVLDLNDVFEVEFSVQITASMREIARLLAELENAEQRFYWTQCSLRPDNIRAPKNVRLIGRLKALVLSSDASEFLAGREGDQS
jgi:hypothetical protein